MVQALVLPGLKDTQCGFKLFSARAVETLMPRQLLTGLGFDVELLFLARKAGFKVGEIPIDWRFEGQSKVTLKKGAWGFLDILKIRVNQVRGRYRGIRKVS
jgi:dolichyl-phosphate beta-glucosyltransferase